MKLSEHVSCRYLLQEFDYTYREMPAGGSKSVRSHMSQVRNRISALRKANPELQPVQFRHLPVLAHLGRALDNGARERMESFSHAFKAVAWDLPWTQGYEKVPKHLQNSYGYCEFIGPEALVPCADLILGFVLFAPDCTYPNHRHDDIAESYVCLSGSLSENDTGVFRPGSLILNKPGQNHRITVSDREPVLLSYAWVGTPQALGGFEMSFSRVPRATGNGK